MGHGHSTFTAQSSLGVSAGEEGRGSPNILTIEPVPEGLEHVVYPKYEEAFRLGLEAFSNPMRVNKFYRPLPNIIGSIEFQNESHAGVIPISKPSGSSGMPTPEGTPYSRRPRMSNAQGDLWRAGPEGSDTGHRQKKGHDWKILKEAVNLEFSSAHRSYTDFEKMQESEAKESLSGNSAASEADAEGKTTLEPVSSLMALDGGLFEGDEAMSNALEQYHLTQGPKRTESPERLTPNRSQLTRGGGERSQVSKDLEELGKSINDLIQQNYAAEVRLTSTISFNPKEQSETHELD